MKDKDDWSSFDNAVREKFDEYYGDPMKWPFRIFLGFMAFLGSLMVLRIILAVFE